MYQLHNPINLPAPCIVIRLADGANIPFDPDNRDYAEYLKWVEAGNTPLPADE
jgi:hypothetical protein